MQASRVLPVLFLVLLFATEAHVSSGMERIDLEELVRRSDAILLVKKATPYSRQESWPFPNPEAPPFKATAYRYKVLSVLKGEVPEGKARSLQVFSESAEDNFAQTQRELEDRPAAMTLHASYQPQSGDPEKEKRFIIFIRRNPATGRFSFTANGGMEKEGNLGAIRKAIEGNHPQPPR